MQHCPKQFAAMKIFPVLALICGCASTQSDEMKSNFGVTDKEVFESVVAANRSQTCKVLPDTLKIPSQVSSARLVWNHSGEPQLLYQGSFRDAVKTVLQPLDRRFQLKGDGFVLGPRNEPYVTDFSFVKDQKNLWAHYRVRNKETQVFEAYSELLMNNKGALHRVKLPVEQGFSVQQSWLLPIEKSTKANVVLRVNKSDFDSEDDEDISNFVWFEIDPLKKTAVKKAAYKDDSNQLSSISFVPMASENATPLAIAVRQVQVDEEATEADQQKSSFRVIAKKVFSSKKEEGTIGESQSAISGLSATSHPDGRTYVAWIEEIGRDVNAIVHWKLLQVDGFRSQQKTPNTKVTQKKLSAKIKTSKSSSVNSWDKAKALLSGELLKIETTASQKFPVRYFPANLRFRKVASPQPSMHNIVLAWSVSIKSGVGYVYTKPDESQNSESNASVVKSDSAVIYSPSPDGTLVGIGEADLWGLPEFLVLAKQSGLATLVSLCSY